MDLANLTAAQAVAAIKARRVKAVDLARAALARAARLKDYNFFICLDPDRALEQAEIIDRRIRDQEAVGPLAGLPFVAKDNIDSADLPTTGGSPAFAGWQPKDDAPVLSAMRKAGAVLIGKTNLHELAYGVTNNNAAYGPAHNPYDRARIPGGSSGGTAAAIAGRVVPAGLGTDTGGSTRIPASMCGCVGFRPSMGRYSQAGVVPLSWTRDTPGPMARTVEDIILLDGVCSRDRPTVHPVSLAGARIGVPRAYFREDIDPAVATAVDDTLRVLREAGATVVEADIPNIARLTAKVRPITGFESLRALAAYLYTHDSRMSVITLVEKVGGRLERAFLSDQLGPNAVDVQTYLEAIHVHRPALQSVYSRYFADHDLTALFVPTVALPAPHIGEDETVALNGKRVSTFLTITRNCSPASAAGLACLTIPVGQSSEGLPIGIDLVGPPMSDARVLALGHAIEQVLAPLPPPEI